ncbi:hypothetical protein CEXT_584151 [Caerostris extrusa]|uniref:Uncharacterized protein n=1 Tax=Caerostris extrusa TaxID=172846 RepID=A0AAV4UBH9_CAEEX|nr:hypothetical protein CEXT_584151 [Caerostris extrusa]
MVQSKRNFELAARSTIEKQTISRISKYFKNDVHDFPKYSSKFSVRSKHRFEQWFADSIPQPDSSANSENYPSSSFKDNFLRIEAFVDIFKLPNDRKDGSTNYFYRRDHSK